MAALALLSATLAGCGGTPEPPSATQLIEDVRHAMETAPSFRFEATWTFTDPNTGTQTNRITGAISGEDIYSRSDLAESPAPFRSIESSVVGGVMYTRTMGYPDDWPDPTAEGWKPSSRDYAELKERGESMRNAFMPPEDLENLAVSMGSENDSWLLTGSYPPRIGSPEPSPFSITPVTVWTARVDPQTSRLLEIETKTDFGIATYESGPNGPASGPQTQVATWRIFDYDADIVVTVPPDVTPREPTPTPRPGGEDVYYTLLLEATDSVTPDEWDATIAILNQRFRGIPGGSHLEWVSVGQVELRLVAHTLTVEQAVALATPKGHFEIVERQCESFPCDVDGAYVDKPTRLTNASIASASSSKNSVTGQPVVIFEMTRATAVALADLTTRLFDTNVIGGAPDQLAFVLDGETLMSAVVSSPILAGSGQVDGDFTADDVQVVAALIANPPLPVGLRLVSAEAQ